jgi:hypothetical protein
MADEQKDKAREPLGFGKHTRGLPGEYAHEQGWGLDVEERTRLAGPPRDTDGGTEYDYSPQDFGDDPVNRARLRTERDEEAARRALGLDGSTKINDGSTENNRGQEETK